MPRPRSPYWHGRDRCFKTRIDGREVTLRHRDGTKVADGDDRGAREAVDRLLAERDAGVRRALDPTVGGRLPRLPDRGLGRVRGRHDGRQGVDPRAVVLVRRPPYGDRPARSIDSADLHRMRRAWEADGYAGGMLSRLYREVGACWAWAARPEPERTPKVILERTPWRGCGCRAGRSAAPSMSRSSAIRELIGFAEGRAEKWGRCVAASSGMRS
jgi:hypothetical protein